MTGRESPYRSSGKVGPGRGRAVVASALAASVAAVGSLLIFQRFGETAIPQSPAATSQVRVSTAEALATHRYIPNDVASLRAAAQLAERTAPPGFVESYGRDLVADGKPWLFVGFDDFTLTSQVGDTFVCGSAHTAADLDAELARLHRLGVGAVRTWFFQSFVAGTSGWQPFDLLLQAAARHQIRVIPVLTNQWGDCEGFDHQPTHYKPISWYTSGYRTQKDYGLPLTYLDYVRTVVQRYRNNSTIAFWQLVNEAEAATGINQPCDEQAAAAAIRAFADAVTSVIKAVDPYHLVSLGTVGTGQCGIAGADYALVHSGKVDLCEYHDYTQGSISGDAWNGIRQDLKTCAALGKPTFAGEAGVDASVGLDWQPAGVVTISSLTRRATFVSDKISAQFAAGTVGFLIWDLSSGPSAGFEVGPGDPVEHAVAVAASTTATPEGLYLRMSRQPS